MIETSKRHSVLWRSIRWFIIFLAFAALCTVLWKALFTDNDAPYKPLSISIYSRGRAVNNTTAQNFTVFLEPSTIDAEPVPGLPTMPPAPNAADISLGMTFPVSRAGLIISIENAELLDCFVQSEPTAATEHSFIDPDRMHTGAMTSVPIKPVGSAQFLTIDEGDYPYNGQLELFCRLYSSPIFNDSWTTSSAWFMNTRLAPDSERALGVSGLGAEPYFNIEAGVNNDDSENYQFYGGIAPGPLVNTPERVRTIPLDRKVHALWQTRGKLESRDRFLQLFGALIAVTTAMLIEVVRPIIDGHRSD